MANTVLLISRILTGDAQAKHRFSRSNNVPLIYRGVELPSLLQSNLGMSNSLTGFFMIEEQAIIVKNIYLFQILQQSGISSGINVALYCYSPLFPT